ncbi:MAG: phosphoglycolate phosphatase [bacterium]
MRAWSGYSSYLFDLDGTLVDTAPDINAALNVSLEKAGLAGVDISLTRHWVGHGSRTLINEALAYLHEPHRDIEPLLADFLQHYRHNLATHSQIYPDVERTLQQLKNRGARLAVVTNKLAQLSEPLLKNIGLSSYFDLIVSGDTAQAPKPDPAPVHLCLQRLDTTAAQTLFVGDSDTDVNAALAAGVDVVCVREGYNHGVDVTTLGATGVIDSFLELLD